MKYINSIHIYSNFLSCMCVCVDVCVYGCVWVCVDVCVCVYIYIYIYKYEMEGLFFLNSIDNSSNEMQEKYGFKTKKHSPHIKEMDNFESDLIRSVKTIKFKKIHNNIQSQMSSDLRRIRESNNIFTKSHKSGNLYKVDRNKYKQMIFKEVIKHYKKVPTPI